MIFAVPKDFTRVRAEQFRWFIKVLGGTKAQGSNGVGYYDKNGLLVALEANGGYYVKP